MTKLLFFSRTISAGLLFWGILDANSQTCAPATTPTLSGQHWAVPTINSLVYIDPNLPTAVQSAISTAVATFQSQTGEAVFVAPAGVTPPNPGDMVNSQGSIYMMNNPTLSPGAIANTGTVQKTTNGQPTNQQVNATTSFNLSYAYLPNMPAYDPTQPNANTFLQQVVLNELGHAFDLNDIPPPGGDFANQTPGASIMNGYVNTNDQGPHANPTPGGPDLPGGVGSGGQVSPCDKKQVLTANPVQTGSGGAGSGPTGGGGSTCVYSCGGGDKTY
jgi:hypothetical protein